MSDQRTKETAETAETALLEKWEIEVCESALAFVHGMKETIVEYFLPETNIAFNFAHDNFHCFRSDGERHSPSNTGAKRLGYYKFPQEISEKLSNFVALKEDLEKLQTTVEEITKRE